MAGTVSPDDPQITISGSVANLQYTQGNGPSEADAFMVSGKFLENSGISVSVTAPFQLATAADGTYAQSINISATNGEVDFVDVFVRLAAGQPLGDYAETVTATAAGAPSKTLNVTGSVLAAASCAPVGSIIITEIMQNPNAVADSAGEYFELYNTTSTDIDIESWIIKDDATASEMHTIATSLVVPANGYIVLGISATGNGGYTPDYVYSNISLANAIDGLIIQCGETAIDTVIWDNGATFPYPTGASMELSMTALNATANDDGANWGEATTPFGDGDLGTPAKANDFTLSLNRSQKLEFSLYPNPATSGTLNINSYNGETFDIEIYSSLGQQVISQKSVTNSINIYNLTTGLYIVKISQGDASQTKKLVVK